MTTPEIFKLASELTEKEINNVLNHWELTNEFECIRLFNSLVKLGDSRELALASAIADKYNNKKSDGILEYNAYYL